MCITGIKRNPSNVSAIYIPSVLEIDGKVYPVKVIEGGALTGNPWITRVMFGEGIEILKTAVCETCPRLERVDLPKSLKFIGGFAFNGCPKITHLELPEGLLYLNPSGLLFGLSGFNTVLKIPASVEKCYLQDQGCTSSQNFPGYEVAESSTHLVSHGRALYSKDGKILYGLPTIDNWMDNIYITPNTVTTIAPGVFFSAPHLKALVITSNVKYITNSMQSLGALQYLYIGAGIVPQSKSNNSGSNGGSDDWGTIPASFGRGWGIVTPKLKALAVSKSSQCYAVEDNVLYNKEKKLMVWMPPSIKRFIFKCPDTCIRLLPNALQHVWVSILSLNKVKQLDAGAIYNIGWPGGRNPNGSNNDVNTQNDTKHERIYGLSMRFSEALEKIDNRGIYATHFNNYVLLDYGKHKYMIEDHMLYLKNNDSQDGNLHTDNNGNDKHNGHWLMLNSYLLPRDNLKNASEGVEVKVNKAVIAVADASMYATNAKTIDYSACKYLKALRYFTAYCGNTQYVLKLPPNLEILVGGETLYYNSNKNGTLDFPATLYQVATRAIYANCKQITFRSKKKNGDLVNDDDKAKAAANAPKVNVGSIFGQINTDCIIRGFKGSYAEEIANRYTLKFQEITDEILTKEDEEAKKQATQQAAK